MNVFEFYILLGSIIFMVISFALLLVRAANGPTVFDKLLAINSINSKINVMLIILSIFSNNQSFIDIAYVYALTSYIAMYSILKFIRNRNLDVKE
ncbi:MAG: cation:proton antiporter [Alphaproteobacteria bacterium]|nr:cation:proton antiporter [Alphaproteobacteria bacterium]